jgi:SAM-dependent methyltransferase
MSQDVPEYGFADSEHIFTAAYLRPPITELLPKVNGTPRLLDIGCGNGSWAGEFLAKGYQVVGIDPSGEGITIARRTHPGARFEQTIAAENTLQQLGEAPFDVVLSTEVVEHLYDPRSWARGALSALKPGGRLICSTPYNGFLKNLAISAANKWDWHLNPLWDGGHIKFWSRVTLTKLLTEVGFVNVQFRGAGRLPFLWKSMVLSGDKPR